MEGSDGVEVMDFAKLKVPELKKELKARGLSTSGNKNDLVERLQNAFKSKIDNNGDASLAESVDELDEDLLNDDDDEPIDMSDTVLGELDGTLNANMKNKAQKRTSDANKKESEEPKAKKIVLNRTPSASDNLSTNGSNKTSEDAQSAAPEDKAATDKKVIKFSDLDAKERFELRAKKFGVEPPSDAKKIARAERFAIGNVSDSTKKMTITSTTPNMDALKQRAQRFGCSVSSAMTKMEEQERLEKRKARFGVVVANNGATTQSDKAKMRLERFKQ